MIDSGEPTYLVNTRRNAQVSHDFGMEVPEPETFSPEVNSRMHELLAEILGPVWVEIQARETRGRAASPPNSRRHILTVLSERADLWTSEFSQGVWPGHAPDYLAFHGMVTILDRARSLPNFSEITAQMVRPEGFRHNMTVL
jgi:hypothetical protein